MLPAVPRKLLYILNSYSATEATHFAHIGRLLEALAQRGIEILLIIEKGDSPPQFSSDAIRVVLLRSGNPFLRYIQLFRHVVKGIKQGFNTIFIRISSRAGLFALLARKLHGGTLYFWQSGTTLEFDRTRRLGLGKFRWYLISRLPVVILQRFGDYFVTGPESMIEYYRRSGVAPEKLRLLYNDVDIERFSGVVERRELRRAISSRCGIDANALVILSIHRLSPVRRTLFYLPYIIEKMPLGQDGSSFVCLVVGGGPELNALKAAVSRAGMAARFRFLGEIPNSQIQDLYMAADIFIQPSYNEGFARVLLEAMAAGLPIVSTDAGGTRDVVGKCQQEFVVSRDDRDEMAMKLKQLIESPATRKVLAEENSRHVQRFATKRVAKMYDDLLFRKT